MPKFNEFQKAAIRAYPNDDFKHLLEENEPIQCDVGDGLFEFIIRELGDDDMDIDTAIQRMETVCADVEAVLHALTKGPPQGGGGTSTAGGRPLSPWHSAERIATAIEKANAANAGDARPSHWRLVAVRIFRQMQKGDFNGEMYAI